MLSSVADRAYWAARYLERVENTARLINVYSNLLLDLPDEAGLDWRQVVSICGGADAFATYSTTPMERAAIRFIAAEPSYSGSMISSIRSARANMRTLREVVPKEAFEAVNELFLFGNQSLQKVVNRRTRYDVLSTVVEQCQQISGLLAGTMSHNAAYQFMRLGQNLERGDMTTRILDVAGGIRTSESDIVNEHETTLWINMLRTLSAYQAYRQSVRQRITPVRAVYFLLADPAFPRSLRFCLGALVVAAEQLPRNAPVLKAIHAAERFLSTLSLRELAGGKLSAHVDDLQRELAGIHAAISDAWLAPSQPTTSGQTQMQFMRDAE